MVLVSYSGREINAKLVYYGPGLSGKTTNLEFIYSSIPQGQRGKMVSMKTKTERTLFFDFLPVHLGELSGFKTRFLLYTVPGQVYYRLSRRAVLQGADGLVFVADSHPARERANVESLADLASNLRSMALTPAQVERIPLVFQWNKRDLPAALPVERLRAALNPGCAPEFEAVACEGRGVSETLRTICKSVLGRLAAGERSQAPPPAMVAPAPQSAAVVPAPAPRP